SRAGRAGGVNPLMTAPDHGADAPRSPGSSGAVLHLQVLGGNPAARAVGAVPLPPKVHYFLGNEAAQWQTDLPTLSRLEYQDVYPGIDLAYYGNQGQWEYDFVVAPGADPRRIQLGFAGADGVVLDEQGGLVVQVGKQMLRQQAPVAYQEAANGGRQVV